MNAVRDIMIILGPPGPEEDKQRLEGWAASSGKPRDEMWVEYIHDVLAHRDSPDSPSQLESLFSIALDTPVRILDPFPTYMFHRGIKCPGVVVYPTKIRSEEGKPLSTDFSNPELRKTLGAVFGYVLSTEWVHAFVSYDS
jgi:hypothetical protein